MKKICLSLFLLGLPFNLFASPQTIKVSGMTCGGCESKVKKVLLQLPGVKEVSADAKTGTVTLIVAEGKTPPSLELIASTTKSAGFKLLR